MLMHAVKHHYNNELSLLAYWLSIHVCAAQVLWQFSRQSLVTLVSWGQKSPSSGSARLNSTGLVSNAIFNDLCENALIRTTDSDWPLTCWRLCQSVGCSFFKTIHLHWHYIYIYRTEPLTLVDLIPRIRMNSFSSCTTETPSDRPLAQKRRPLVYLQNQQRTVDENAIWDEWT